MKMKEEECTIEMILFEYSLKPRMLFQPYTRIVPSFSLWVSHFLTYHWIHPFSCSVELQQTYSKVIRCHLRQFIFRS